jgi:hypothetical protein
MRTTSADKTYIDYWQDYGTGRKATSGFGCGQTDARRSPNVGTESPNLFGVPRKVPIDLSSSVGQHSLNNMVGERMQRHPDSDLVAVLTGKKPFNEALE